MRGALTIILIAALGLNSRAQHTQTDDDLMSAKFECRLVTAQNLDDPAAPLFASFPSDTSIPARHGKLDVTSSPTARKYRTRLRDAMRREANFAGHYRVVVWGCGTACSMFAVVDLESGKIITAPHVDAIGGDELSAADFLPDAVNDDYFWGLRYTRDSRLLVVSVAWTKPARGLLFPAHRESTETGTHDCAPQELPGLTLIPTMLVCANVSTLVTVWLWTAA
jgi:hypothetical protein